MAIDWNALAAPFEEHEIEWRVGSTYERDGQMYGLALAYVTNRAIQDRLDTVLSPENWKNEYLPAPQGGVLCGLSIRIDGEWITKWDGADNTEYEAVKGGLSDAMKRAAVQWGIGRYLYRAESEWYPVEKRGRTWVFSRNVKPLLKIAGKPSEEKKATAQKGKGSSKPIEPEPVDLNWFDHLDYQYANVSTGATASTINKRQQELLISAMGDWFTNEQAAYVITTWGKVKNSAGLHDRQLDTLLKWCASERIVSDLEVIKVEVKEKKQGSA